MNKERAHLLRLGVLTAFGLAVFAGLVFIFQPMVRRIRGGFYATIHMKSAGELKRGTPVRYLGIDAGTVEGVRYAPPQLGGVLIDVRLSHEANIRNDPKAAPYVETKLVTGEAYIEFPRADPMAPLLKSGDQIEGEYRLTAPDLIATLSKVAHTADDTLVAIEEAVNDLRRDFKSVAAPAREAAQGAADLLAKRPLDDPSRPLKPGEANISTAVQRLDGALLGINKAVASINGLVGDETLHGDVTASTANIRKASERVLAASTEAEQAMKRLRAFADRTDTMADKAEHVLDTAAAAVASQDRNLTRVGDGILDATGKLGSALGTLQTVLNDVRAGKGSLGQLLTDPAAFERLLAAIGQIEQTFRDVSVLVSELQDHPGDYIKLGARSTSEKERKERIDKKLTGKERTLNP